MPKVESSDHRNRHRPTPIPRPRFPTLRAEQHTYEFDCFDQSLRVSWSGGQTFLSQSDAKQLHGVLNRIYDTSDRPTTLYRQERRARRHSHRQVKGEEQQANPQPDQEANATHKEAALEFGEYNGWPNRPTWSVFMVMTSYDEPREQLERMALQQPGGMGNVKRAVIGSVEHWKNDKSTPYEEAARSLVQDFLLHGIWQVEWTPVFDTLRGARKELGERNTLTTLAHQLLSQTDWQSIVKDEQYLVDADNTLMGWLQDQCLTWIASPDARKHTGSVGKFANTVLDIYFQAVQWEKVTDALKGK
jgi:hypothetical protein